MKKIFALSLSVLLCTVVFAGGTDNTSGASGIAVIKRDANTYKLIYKADKAGDVKVSIRDSKNEVIFQELIKTNDGFVRPYNLESLAQGEYTMEIVDKSGKQIEKLNNYASKVVKTFNVRKIQSNEEDKIVLSVSGKGKETINVKIYDGTHTLVYNEDKEVAGDFAQLYNLKNVKGAVTFEVTGENGESKTVYY